MFVKFNPYLSHALGFNEGLVLSTIVWLCENGKYNQIETTISELMNYTALGYQTIVRALNELEKKHLILKKRFGKPQRLKIRTNPQIIEGFGYLYYLVKKHLQKDVNQKDFLKRFGIPYLRFALKNQKQYRVPNGKPKEDNFRMDLPRTKVPRPLADFLTTIDVKTFFGLAANSELTFEMQGKK